MTTIGYRTTVDFDYGAVKLIGSECQRLRITRPLVVTDRGIQASGLLGRLRENLPGGARFEHRCATTWGSSRRRTDPVIGDER
jgi:alcohol dehydrogenase class IV